MNKLRLWFSRLMGRCERCDELERELELYRECYEILLQRIRDLEK